MNFNLLEDIVSIIGKTTQTIGNDSIAVLYASVSVCTTVINLIDKNYVADKGGGGVINCTPKGGSVLNAVFHEYVCPLFPYTETILTWNSNI